MLNEQDYKDLVDAAQLLMGIIGRYGVESTERVEALKKSKQTERLFIYRI